MLWEADGGLCEATGALRQGMQTRKLLRELMSQWIPVKGMIYPWEGGEGMPAEGKMSQGPGCICVWEREEQIFRVSSIITRCIFLPGLFSSVFLLTISLKPYSTDLSVLEKTDSSQTLSDGLLSLKPKVSLISLSFASSHHYMHICVLSRMNEWWIHVI